MITEIIFESEADFFEFALDENWKRKLGAAVLATSLAAGAAYTAKTVHHHAEVASKNEHHVQSVLHSHPDDEKRYHESRKAAEKLHATPYYDHNTKSVRIMMKTDSSAVEKHKKLRQELVKKHNIHQETP